MRSGKSGPSVKSAGSRGESAPIDQSDNSAAINSTPSVEGDAGGSLEFGVKNYGVADKTKQVNSFLDFSSHILAINTND